MKARASLLVAGACAVIAVGGCTGSLLESKLPAPVTYVLAAPEVKAAAQAIAANLAIGVPRVAAGLEGPHIATLNGRQLDRYAGVRWGANVSIIIQQLLVRTFSSAGTFRNVSADEVRSDSEYLLEVEVIDFQAEYHDSSVPEVHVGLIGRLIRVHDRALVATIASESISPADSNRMSAVVAAFEAAAQSASIDLAQKVTAAVPVKA